MADKLSAEGLKSAADMTKQIVTLSTGVITITVTFLEKITQVTAPSGNRTVPWTLFAAWVGFGIAILAAVVTLGAITGSLDAIDRKLNGYDTSSEQERAAAALSASANVRIPAQVMSGFFLLGMILTIATGFLLLR